ncbi:hypothetical protein CsatA_013516 [Cannabis sativa]
MAPHPSKKFRSADQFPNDDYKNPNYTLHEVRDALPSHHLLKIESFSSLVKASVENYSSEFTAGGYNWKFSVYPSGDKSIEGKDHISLYLEIVETSSLPTGWEVNAIFNLFLFDQIRDKFISFEGIFFLIF